MNHRDFTAFCGLDCSTCPAYLATRDDDAALRAKTAAEWSAAYNADIKPADIVCEGCTRPGRKFRHCGACEIRACGTARGYDTCAPCPDYPCAKLEPIFGFAPDAKTRLDGLRGS